MSSLAISRGRDCASAPRQSKWYGTTRTSVLVRVRRRSAPPPLGASDGHSPGPHIFPSRLRDGASPQPLAISPKSTEQLRASYVRASQRLQGAHGLYLMPTATSGPQTLPLAISRLGGFVAAALRTTHHRTTPGYPRAKVRRPTTPTTRPSSNSVPTASVRPYPRFRRNEASRPRSDGLAGTIGLSRTYARDLCSLRPARGQTWLTQPTPRPSIAISRRRGDASAYGRVRSYRTMAYYLGRRSRSYEELTARLGSNGQSPIPRLSLARFRDFTSCERRRNELCCTTPH